MRSDNLRLHETHQRPRDSEGQTNQISAVKDGIAQPLEEVAGGILAFFVGRHSGQRGFGAGRKDLLPSSHRPGGSPPGLEGAPGGFEERGRVL